MQSKLPSAFGRALRRLRVHAALTQEELGFKAGLQRNYVSSLELGEKQPTLTSICKLAQALGLKPGQLLDSMEDETDDRAG